MHPADTSQVNAEQSRLQAVVMRLKQGEKYATIQDNDPDFPLLEQAVSNNAIEALLWLVSAGASVNPASGSLLLLAVQRKYWSAAQILLCLGASKTRNINAADDSLQDDIKALTIEKNLFQALLYWAVINYPISKTVYLLDLLASSIVGDQPALAELTEKKSSDLHEPLLVSQPTVNAHLAQQLRQNFACLVQLARRQGQPELVTYLQTFNNQPEAVNSVQMLADSEHLNENYLRVLAPLLAKTASYELNLPRTDVMQRGAEKEHSPLPLRETDQKISRRPLKDIEDIKEIKEPTLSLAMDNEVEACSGGTNVTEIDDFLNNLHDELTGRCFRFKRLTGFDKGNLFIFIAMWAVIIPSVLVSDRLVNQGNAIRSRMANTPYDMNPLLHCDIFFNSQQRYQCDRDMDFSNCEDLCSALSTINPTLTWLLGLGIVAPAIVALFALPSTLLSLYQLSSEDLTAFDDLPLTACSARLQRQAKQLLVKLQLAESLEYKMLSVDSSVKTMRLALEKIKNSYHSVSDLRSSPPPSSGNSNGLAVGEPRYAYQRRNHGRCDVDAIKDTTVSDTKQP